MILQRLRFDTRQLRRLSAAGFEIGTTSSGKGTGDGESYRGATTEYWCRVTLDVRAPLALSLNLAIALGVLTEPAAQSLHVDFPQTRVRVHDDAETPEEIASVPWHEKIFYAVV